MIVAITRRSALALTAYTATLFFTKVARSEQGAQSRAPFGLAWEQSADEIRKLGVNLVPVSESNMGTAFTATNLPKILRDAESVTLGFGFDNKLFRVVAVGPTNSSDPYGNKTLQRYDELSTALSENYGKGMETDQRDTEVWKSPSEYVMSIKQGRALRYTEFSEGGMGVELSVRALDGDSSYWMLIYGSSAGEALFNIAKKKKEQDAL